MTDYINISAIEARIEHRTSALNNGNYLSAALIENELFNFGIQLEDADNKTFWKRL